MGAIGLGQQLKHLQTTASVMHTGAHPDDEDSGLLAYLARHEQARTAYLSLNRGEGGQNVIGSELFEPLVGTATFVRVDSAHVAALRGRWTVDRLGELTRADLTLLGAREGAATLRMHRVDSWGGAGEALLSIPVRVRDAGTAPDTLPRAARDSLLSVSVGRSTLRRGDTTTVRVVLRNPGPRAITYVTERECPALRFSVIDAGRRVSAWRPPVTCQVTTSAPLRGRDSAVVSQTWRADQGGDAAAPLAPGLYIVRADASGDGFPYQVAELLLRVLP